MDGSRFKIRRVARKKNGKVPFGVTCRCFILCHCERSVSDLKGDVRNEGMAEESLSLNKKTDLYKI